MVTIREYSASEVVQMTAIWNEVVESGVAFPQKELLTPESAPSFFASQSFTAVAVDSGRVLGLYILHPNNVGRVGRLANASYAVTSTARGQHIGEALVKDSLEQGRRLGFRALQFNAVVATNARALHLYDKLGFVRLGTIPAIYEMPDGSFQDIILFYHLL